jgi:hypothetical protein
MSRTDTTAGDQMPAETENSSSSSSSSITSSRSSSSTEWTGQRYVQTDIRLSFISHTATAIYALLLHTVSHVDRMASCEQCAANDLDFDSFAVELSHIYLLSSY